MATTTGNTAAPLYQVGDVVYLTESSQIGFIESYEVSGVRMDTNQRWMYQFSIVGRPPLLNSTVGDRIRLNRSIDFEVGEEELVDFCTALDNCIAYHTSALASLNSKRASLCPDDTGGSG